MNTRRFMRYVPRVHAEEGQSEKNGPSSCGRGFVQPLRSALATDLELSLVYMPVDGNASERSAIVLFTVL